MTDAELDEIAKRAEAATAGPWNRWFDLRAFTTPSAWGKWEFERREDVDFVIAAREDVPRLVAEVRRLREEREAMELAALAADAQEEDGRAG